MNVLGFKETVHAQVSCHDAARGHTFGMLCNSLVMSNGSDEATSEGAIDLTSGIY